jgi:hypothetical protein
MAFYPTTLNELTRKYCWYRSEIIKNKKTINLFANLDKHSSGVLPDESSNILDNIASYREVVLELKESLNYMDEPEVDDTLKNIWKSYLQIKKSLSQTFVIGRQYERQEIIDMLDILLLDTDYACYAMGEFERADPDFLKLFGINLKAKTEYFGHSNALFEIIK